MKRSRRSLLPLSAILALAVAPFSQAGTLYWDNFDSATSTAGTGLWNAAVNWSTDAAGTTNATAAPTSADDVIFSASNITADHTVNLGATRSARSLTFSSAFGTTILTGSTSAFNINIGAGGISVLAGAGAVNIGSGSSDGVPVRMTAGQTWSNESSNTLSIKNSVALADNLGAQTLTVTGSGNTIINAEIRDANTAGGTSSALSLTKTGTGTLTLSSGTSNKYTGLTTVTGGTLTLGKSAGLNAIAGNILINGGTLNWGSNANQVADTSNIEMTSGAILLNGRTETINNLSISGGQFTTGGSAFTANAISLNSLSATTLMIVSTGATVTTNSLDLTGTAHPLGGTSLGGNLLIGGNSTGVATRLIVGAGGMSMNNQVVQFNLVNASALGARIELGGNFTGNGNNVIGYATSGNSPDTSAKGSLDLGAANRTFAINSGTTTIGVPVTGTGGIQKTGSGLLRIGGTSTYTGATEVTGGTFNVTGALTATTSLSVSNATFSYGASDAVNNAATVSLGSGAVLQMNGFSDALGVLAVTGSAELALSGGSSSIVSFADSTSATWTSAALSITGWDGLSTGGGGEQVTVANGGLTQSQLASIFFVNPAGFASGTYSAKFINNELVPDQLIPEPSTLAAVLLGAGGLLLRRKRTAATA